MKYPHILTFALLALFFASCETVVDFDVEDIEPMLVLHARGSTDDNVSARLSYSRFFLDDRPFQVVKNALVTLQVNGGSPMSLGYSDGLYVSSYTPQPGDTLTLVAKAGDKEVTAGTRVPRAPLIADVKVAPSENYGGYYEKNAYTNYMHKYMDVDVQLNDPANERNYYSLSMVVCDTIRCKFWMQYPPDGSGITTGDTVDTVIYIRQTLNMECEDVAVIGTSNNIVDLIDEGLEPYVNTAMLLFEDDKINGRNYKVRVTIAYCPYQYVDNMACAMGAYILNTTTLDITGSPHLEVRLDAVPREVYLYEKSVESQENDELAGIFTEPTQVAGNVNGGIGIFGIRSRTKVVRDISAILND